MSKNLFLEATPSEEEKPRENLEREILVLKEDLRKKETEVGTILSENEELKERVEVLLKLLENHNIPAPCFPSRGGEIPPLNMSSRITTNAFEHDKNIEDKEDTKKDLFSVEYTSFSSIGMKNTLTSENPDTHSCTGSTNGPAEIYIPKCNNIPSLELPSSRSLESESSSKELCKEAWVAYYFPHLNISPPGTPNMFSEPFTYCEECKKVHYTYHYCYYKPCAACYSKEHHFINCPYLDFIPQGAVFNRDVFEVVCGCCSPFDQDEWFCSCCFGKSRVTKLKVKFCFLCLTIGHHNYCECPEDKVGADKHRSSREAKFNSAKARSLLLPPTESYSTIKRDGWCRASAISRLQRT